MLEAFSGGAMGCLGSINTREGLEKAANIIREALEEGMTRCRHMIEQ